MLNFRKVPWIKGESRLEVDVASRADEKPKCFSEEGPPPPCELCFQCFRVEASGLYRAHGSWGLNQACSL